MDLDRIKDNVTITSAGCWEWNKSLTSAGYGQLMEDRKYWSTHRYAYACVYELLDSDIIRHSCHNARCCNPEHLSAGTHKDNYADSREAHIAAQKHLRKKWSVNGTSYGTCREVVELTGLSMNSVLKYTVDGVFDVVAYHKGCKIANVVPKV